LYDTRRIKPREIYKIEKDAADQFLRFIYQPNVETEYIIYKDQMGELTAKRNSGELERKVKSVKGSIQTTLYDAVLGLGETPELLIAFSDIFQWDIDFFIDPRQGDEFKIIYEVFLLPNDSSVIKSQKERFVRYGKILAAQYVLQGENYTAFYFDNSPKDDGYYTLDGESFQKTFLKSPLNYRRISSYFSYGRRHPILKTIRPHYGVDFAAPTGTPVSAAADGIVIKTGSDNQIGNYVKIRHKNQRFVTLYGHLSRFAKGIKAGTAVKQKDIIGYVGKTGLATGPHLHYTFYENGKPINPLKIKNTSGDPICETNWHKFEAVRSQMVTYLEELDRIHIPIARNLAMMVHVNRYMRLEP